MSILEFFRKLFGRVEAGQPELPQPEEPQKPPREEERFVLCIDGGGMRGIIPTVLLQQLETGLRENDGFKDIASYFDLVAGTSTGGLIALALTCSSTIAHKDVQDGQQVSLEALLESYMSMGERIFQKVSFLGLHQIASNKYHSSPIERYTKELFSDGIMCQAKVPTMIMTYDLSEGMPHMIRSYDAENQYPAWIAARATSAAPTYFSPVEFNDKVLVDGGVVANNPALYAYLEAKRLYPDCHRFHILSISTDGARHTMEASETSGLLSWADQVSPMYTTAQGRTTDAVLEAMPDVEYVRLYDPLPEHVKMDETSPAVLQRVYGYATMNSAKHIIEIDDFARKLVENDTYRKESCNAPQTGRA